jgi:hypothetical protein
MAFIIRRMVAQCKTEEFTSDLLNHLLPAGYNPLIIQAKQQFLSVLGHEPPMEAVLKPGQDIYMTAAYEMASMHRIGSRYRNEFRVPISGDIFFSPAGHGFLYILFTAPDESISRRHLEEEKSDLSLEVGYLGEEEDVECLDALVELVKNAMLTQNPDMAWNLLQRTSPQFNQLADSEDVKFISASTFTEADFNLAKLLEDPSLREAAITVKRSGSILAVDFKRKSEWRDKEDDAIKELLDMNLISKEYIIFCRKTSNPINRIKSKDYLLKMGEIGVLCSCGNPISGERVEELFSPTSTLQKMLDQSYWTSVRFVDVLHQLNIPNDRILLNINQGSEEMDAFVDIDGVLLMVELKDSEFSMGHAYPFGGRIGLYKPDYAIIVSTKGVAPEVRDYFNRVKPEANLVYINRLDELLSSLREVITEVRAQLALQILSLFGPMATIQLPISQMFSERLGISVKPGRGRVVSYM